MDPRLPHHIEDGTFVVIDGPDDAGASAQIDGLWRAAHGLGHGTKPLFDRLPVFTSCPPTPDGERTHWEQVVAPALASGRAVFMQGRYAGAHGRQPDVTFLVNPQEEPDGDVVTLRGDRGEVGEGLFAELIHRGLYTGRPSTRARR